jgi:DNA-binding NtrC family response regulator
MSTKPIANVLLLEDDPTVAELNTLILERDGHTVTTYENGRTGLDHFLSSPNAYDVVILDIVMPGLGGTEVLRGIHGVRPDLPVLLCSGYAPEPSLREVIDGKTVRFLKKPYDVSELLERLHALFEASAR